MSDLTNYLGQLWDQNQPKPVPLPKLPDVNMGGFFPKPTPLGDSQQLLGMMNTPAMSLPPEPVRLGDNLDQHFPSATGLTRGYGSGGRGIASLIGQHQSERTGYGPYSDPGHLAGAFAQQSDVRQARDPGFNAGQGPTMRAARDAAYYTQPQAQKISADEPWHLQEWQDRLRDTFRTEEDYNRQLLQRGIDPESKPIAEPDWREAKVTKPKGKTQQPLPPPGSGLREYTFGPKEPRYVEPGEPIREGIDVEKRPDGGHSKNSLEDFLRDQYLKGEMKNADDLAEFGQRSWDLPLGEHRQMQVGPGYVPTPPEYEPLPGETLSLADIRGRFGPPSMTQEQLLAKWHRDNPQPAISPSPTVRTVQPGGWQRLRGLLPW